MMRKQKTGIPRRDKSSPKLQQNKRLYYEYSDNLRDTGLVCMDTERAERIRETLEALYEVNKRIPIIVEGKRDVRALKRVGMVGDIITVHAGRGLYEFCEELAERFHRVVLLMDWDEKGDELFRNLSRHLKGLWEEFSVFRDILKILCQKDIREIEGMPALLARLAGTEVVVREPEEV